MKLYIANGTNQVQHFVFRIPGPNWTRPIDLEIPQGMQALVPGGDLLPEEVESVVIQLQRYGAVESHEVERVNRAKPFACLCYSIDKPVTPPKIEKLFHHNQAVLEKRAEDGLLNTALANNKVLTERLEETARMARHAIPEVKAQDITIMEVPRTGSPRKTTFFKNGKDASDTIRMGNA